jgi:hypothetical protein
VRGLLLSGYNGGAWNGSGIITSQPTVLSGPLAGKAAAVGYGEASALPGGTPSTFAGQPVDATTVVLKYTLSGDTQLDGDVDLDDIGPWSTNFTGELGGGGGATKVWAEGDWDYDGDVDLDDAGKWSVNFTGELGGGGLGPAGQSLYLGDAISSIHPTAKAALQAMGITVVPEPSTAALIGFGFAGVALRRLRRQAAGTTHARV